MFHIVTLLLLSSIMFAAVYQFWLNTNDMMMIDWCVEHYLHCTTLVSLRGTWYVWYL